MVRLLALTVLTALSLTALGACTSDQLYAAGRNAQKQSCLKMPDTDARERCMRDAAMSRDRYEQDAGVSRP